MTTEHMIFVGVLGLLIPPAIIYAIRKSGGKGNVVVTCPGCGTDLKIGRLRNYTCPKCNEEVEFFDPKTKKPLRTVETVQCSDCGQHHPLGVKFCIKCKTLLRQTAAPEDDAAD